MGDRFYAQQAKYKPRRVLKKDVIAELNSLLPGEVSGLDRLTIKTLDDLIRQIKALSKTKESGNG